MVAGLYGWRRSMIRGYFDGNARNRYRAADQITDSRCRSDDPGSRGRRRPLFRDRYFREFPRQVAGPAAPDRLRRSQGGNGRQAARPCITDGNPGALNEDRIVLRPGEKVTGRPPSALGERPVLGYI